MQKPLIILGAGGFARELFAWAMHSQRQVNAFFEESPVHSVPDIFGVPIYSTLENFKYADFLLGIGDPLVKAKLWEIAVSNHLTPALPLVHASAVIGHNVNIALGAVVCPNVVITSDVMIDAGVMINIGATIGHDCRIGSMATISPGANISGFCSIGERSYIGTNAAIREKITIGRGSVVGMGSVVVKNVPDEETHIGTPARKMLRSV